MPARQLQRHLGLALRCVQAEARTGFGQHDGAGGDVGAGFQAEAEHAVGTGALGEERGERVVGVDYRHSALAQVVVDLSLIHI